MRPDTTDTVATLRLALPRRVSGDCRSGGEYTHAAGGEERLVGLMGVMGERNGDPCPYGGAPSSGYARWDGDTGGGVGFTPGAVMCGAAKGRGTYPLVCPVLTGLTGGAVPVGACCQPECVSVFGCDTGSMRSCGPGDRSEKGKGRRGDSDRVGLDSPVPLCVWPGPLWDTVAVAVTGSTPTGTYSCVCSGEACTVAGST